MDFEVSRRVATLAATDTGRGSSRLAVPVRDDLGAAADALVRGAGGHVGLITGFYIPRAQPPAAETDGPLGAALLAETLTRLGTTVDVVTDELCLPVVQAALSGVGPGGPSARLWHTVDTALWTHVVSVERVGRTVDGSYRNMLGTDISDVTAPIDSLFEALTIPKIAIGDGGNEIGMGRLDAALIAAVVRRGAEIRCVVECDHLIVSGTSNWGAYALAALITAKAALRPDDLSENTSLSALQSIVRAGGVDGVTATADMTVDGLSWDQYWAIPRQVHAALFAPGRPRSA